ncbi:prepilin-type N-terminal cleavage/methylation domain-containing protein [Rubrivivax gelatinosus]|uniref:Prepilin-type N-terminal cleavage/methylation domain-containing protein n=1 Tax=Rubrivivax gelatinosus TaxID=28068 RepID=A0A4R2M5N1_RUBGE|nr:prepilin-type N-terminal cleavage/methylation domain-containing protein [Rubrivivax gelatinosus]MBK1689722.1 hypothetical protein [Rubrivivax gelatinosus]TCP01520.1 prepilin-type N-terminal cleavage/methylation domain-containing protein [Rubrivivax gelatinosus]
MLNKLLALSREQRAAVVDAIDPALVAQPWAKKRLKKIKGKQGGFTLLELLVVVAIIAAIAGTATILLRDTDRQASAAAHVAMMDELMKGISTYQVLNDGMLPSNFDSLMRNGTDTLVGATSAGAVDTDVINADLAASLAPTTIPADVASLLVDAGVSTVRLLNSAADPNGADGAGDCSATGIRTLITNKGNDVTAATIYRSATSANGCGFDTNYTISATATDQVLQLWEEPARVNADTTKAAIGASQTQYLVALGIGPDTSLFNPEKRGAMTTVPVYRHVTKDEYNRFVALLNVDTEASEVRLQAIIDGAGDTKDEELGEWDGTRSTL